MKRILLMGAALIWMSSVAHGATCSGLSNTSSGSNVSVLQTTGPALCSVTQDNNYSSTMQLGVPVSLMRPSEVLEKKLNGLGLTTSPYNALSLASMTPPEQWTEGQFVDTVTVLIALSERAENIRAINTFLENNKQRLYGVFVSPAHQQRAERFEGLEPYRASVSYGCLELFKGGAYRSMIRVPSSSSQRQCDTF
jgi:hypothetical protein